MPPKIVAKPSSSSNEPENKKVRQQGKHAVLQGVEQAPPTIMATATTRTQTIDYAVPIHDGRYNRLTPILPVPPAMFSSQEQPLSSATSPSGLTQGPIWSPGPYTPSNRVQPAYFPPQQQPPRAPAQSRSPAGSYHPIRSAQPENSLPQKRPREPQDAPYGLPPQVNIPTPLSVATRNPLTHNAIPPQSSRSSTSAASTPSSTAASFPLQGQRSVYSRPPSEISSNTITSRCSLHIRQQPRAARAGPDGKDRRNIDPPPVLQLLLMDFDPDSPTDLSELKSNHYVVHCKLISADSPGRDVTTQTTVSEDGSRETSRLLLGTNVASPFFCADDPDISKMPQHPRTADTIPEGPPSPSARFFPPPAAPTSPASLPGAFFIFADLSVRRAGSYRLEFTLMKIDHTAMNLPMIHICVSHVFKVVNAKDFDQVHQSTDLVKGLLERGAPFPLKLKKGIREGQKRRMTDTGEEVGSVEGSIEGSRPDEEREDGYD